MININQLVTNIIEEKIDVCNEILCNDDYFDEVTGILQCDLLKELIIKSYKSKEIRAILGQILYYANSCTISDEIFSKIINYPNKRVRINSLIALSHCSISFYQLMYINELKIGTEAFAQLFHTICVCDCFSEFDILHLLKLSRYIDDKVVRNCISNILNKNLSQTKHDFLMMIIDQY